MNKTKIKIENLYKIFGRNSHTSIELVEKGMSKDELLEKKGHVLGLHNINMSIEESSVHVVMGLSGSGKSTLIRHINRLIDPTAGIVEVDGEDITKLDAIGLNEFRKNKTGMVFQRFGLLPHMDILDNVTFGLDIKKIEKSISQPKAMDWLKQVGLDGYERRYPQELSGGMQQRVGLARALTNDPEILLMDEAFSALDPLIKKDMQDILIDLQKKLKKTIVFITHDLDEAVRVGHRIAIMRDGKVIQIGTPEEIVVSPADEYVADFVKGISRLKVVQAKSIMQSVESYEKKNGKLWDNPESVQDDELLSKLIEKSKDKPLIVKSSNKKIIGVITQADLLKAVIEGGDGE